MFSGGQHISKIKRMQTNTSGIKFHLQFQGINFTHVTMAAIMVNGLNENDEEEDGIDFEAEAEQAFQRLANASSNYDKPQPRIIHPELPSCISNSKTPFPCLICGRSFPDVSSIRKHAKTHEYHRSPTQVIRICMLS